MFARGLPRKNRLLPARGRSAPSTHWQFHAFNVRGYFRALPFLPFPQQSLDTVPRMRFGKKASPDHVFDPAKVDLLADSADGFVELVIVQGYPWTGSDAQVASLQEKVQGYVSFAVDGQLAAQFPESDGRARRIVVASTAGSPDPRTRSILQALAERLPRYGGALEVR